jgi:hypothetical protein
MGVVQGTDEVQRLIEHQVANSHAISPSAFLEEAVLHPGDIIMTGTMTVPVAAFVP